MERSTQHAFVPEEVMAYLDGELEPQRATALAAHLQHCAACQEVAQGFRALSEKMLEFDVEPPSVHMNETVLAALDSAKLPTTAGVQHAADRKSWNWRHLFARPRNWAIVSAVTVVAVAAVAIPSLFREHSIPMNGPSFGHLVRIEPGVANSQAVNQKATSASELSEAWDAPAAPPPPPPGDDLKAPESVGPMIVQTASLNILATNYDEASAAIEKLAAAHGGYVEKLDAKAQTGNARELSASLRIPAKQLDAFLADVRKLGHVEEENRSNEEVSDQYVDLQARLKSARATEQRLIELLGHAHRQAPGRARGRTRAGPHPRRDREHAGAERAPGAPGELCDGGSEPERRIPPGSGLGRNLHRNEAAQRPRRGVQKPSGWRRRSSGLPV